MNRHVALLSVMLAMLICLPLARCQERAASCEAPSLFGKSSETPAAMDDSSLTSALQKRMELLLHSLPDGNEPDGINTTLSRVSWMQQQPSYFSQNDASVSFLAWNNDHQALAVSMDGMYWSLPHDTLNRREGLVPSTLSGGELGLTFFHEWQANDAFIVSIRFGSFADRPFVALRDMQLSAAMVWQTPINDHSSWIAGAMIDTVGRLPSVPIPVLGYQFHSIDDHWTGMLGFPTSDVSYHVNDSLLFSFDYTLLTMMRLRAKQQLTDHWRWELGTLWRRDFWYRSERVRDNEQLMYSEKKIYSDLSYEFSNHCAFHVGTGWMFQRSFQYIDGFWTTRGSSDRLGSSLFLQAGLTLIY